MALHILVSLLCLLEKQPCEDKKINSTARVGGGWLELLSEGKEVAGLWEKPHTTLC